MNNTVQQNYFIIETVNSVFINVLHVSTRSDYYQAY